MKIQHLVLLTLTLWAANGLGQDGDATSAANNKPIASSAADSELRERGESSQKTRIKLSTSDEDKLKTQGKSAQKVRIKLSDMDKSKLAQQGASAQKARVNLNDNAKSTLTQQGQAAQSARVKLSATTKSELAKQGSSAQTTRVNISDSEKAKLTRQGNSAQQARVKLSPSTEAKLSAQGNMAQQSRQGVATTTTKPLKGILKGADGTANSKPISQKQVTFNEKVQTKQIPTNPAKKLASGKSTALNKPVTSSNNKSSKGGGKIGKAAGAVAAAGIVAEGISTLGDAEKERQAGTISQSEYQRKQATNIVNVAGEAVKLKKLNPSALLLNDVIGTDPISLGVDGVGDLFNGTNNAQKSIENMENAWNKSLTKQAFTDPKGAAERVGKDIEAVGRDASNLGQKAGKELDKAGQAIGGEFKKAGADVGKAAESAKKAVGNEVKKAGKTIDKAAKDVGNFFKGAFDKK